MNRKSDILTKYSNKRKQEAEELLSEELLQKITLVFIGMGLGSIFTFLIILFLY